MIAFCDTNVLLDVLAKREPFYDDSARVWALAETGRLRAQVSVLSFADIYYIVRRMRDREAAAESMRLLRDTFESVPFDAKILGQAIDSDLRDFEDAIQFYSALRAGADCVVTRNPAHFPTEDLAIVTPAQFLAVLAQSSLHPPAQD